MQRHEFRGRDAQEAKRRALDFWYAQRATLRLTLSQFFAHCRASAGEGSTCITFYPEGPEKPLAARTAA